jgi:hypothetical protein
MMLGDAVSAALAAAGADAERVSRWLGRDCGCEERRQRLNALHSWAVRVLRGRREKALEYLELLCK